MILRDFVGMKGIIVTFCHYEFYTEVYFQGDYTL